MNTAKEETSSEDSVREDEVHSLTLFFKQEDKKHKANLNLKREKNILYGTGADALCEFGNGESIRVNKSFLAYHSPVFNDLFFGESPTTTVKIEDFDCDAFRTFLDCLFGFKEYTVLGALLIYPIAHKYDVEKCLEICAKILIPDQMSENVYLTLNLATFYEDTELENEVLSFLNLKVGFFNFLDNKNYLLGLLEPLVISRIIEKTEMNSLLWTLIYRWGELYLENHNKPNCTIRLLFEENDILTKLSLKNFESALSVLNFHDDSNKEILDPNEVLGFLKRNLILFKELPEASSWKRIKKGEKIIEEIRFCSSFWASIAEGDKTISVSTNTMYPKKLESVNCSLRLYQRTNSYGPYLDLLPDQENIFERNKVEFRGDFPRGEFRTTLVEITYNFLCDCVILKTSFYQINVFSCLSSLLTRNIKVEVKKDAGI